ncbi:MAG: DUF4281 domain-containing protein [Gammaproteobacteria bacterium]|nr:DUF4281 domain-containing protein [Gammaproteobacteria bacterium]
MIEADLLFTICNRAVLPAWLLLVLAPGWDWTRRLVFHAWIPALLAVAYIYCFYRAMPIAEGAGFSSLQQVLTFFESPFAATAGWIHYLAFDLFVGAWQVRDAQRHGIHHGWVIPCLILTLMAGPVGLLLYFVIRFIRNRQLTTVESRV